MSEWISVKDQLPEFNLKVKVKVGDLRHLMMGLEFFLPTGEYISTYRKNSEYCCNDPRHLKYHQRLHWSNNAGYYATHWMAIKITPKDK